MSLQFMTLLIPFDNIYIYIYIFFQCLMYTLLYFAENKTQT